MARIAGVNIPREKRVEIGLTYIFGIGRSTTNDVLKELGLNPDTKVRMPCSMAFLPTASAAICAANGVDLREPLKPCAPDEAQAMALPWASVMVIMVLLKVAFTCATPDVMFLRSRRRRRGAGAVPVVAAAGVAAAADFAMAVVLVPF